MASPAVSQGNTIAEFTSLFQGSPLRPLKLAPNDGIDLMRYGEAQRNDDEHLAGNKAPQSQNGQDNHCNHPHRKGQPQPTSQWMIKETLIFPAMDGVDGQAGEERDCKDCLNVHNDSEAAYESV